MAKNYYGNRGQGAHLRHYRTKGSKNGVSKDPNYRPVGEKAVGRIINGRYVYEQVKAASERGAANNWQQQGNYARAGGEAINRAVAGQTRGVHMKLNAAQENQGIAGMIAKARRDSIKAGAKNNWQQEAASEANSHMQRNRLVEGKAGQYAIAPKSLNGQVITVPAPKNVRKQYKETPSAMKMTAAGYQPYRNGMAHPAYSEVGSANMRIAERVAKKKAHDRMQAQGAANNWQQRANQDSSFGRHDEWQFNPKKPGINAVSKSTAHYSPSALQEGYTVRQTGTIAGNVDRAKRALNVTKVNTKKKLQKTGAKIAEQAPVYADKVAKKASQYATEAKKATAAAASNLTAKGKNTVDNILNKLKKKKK